MSKERHHRLYKFVPEKNNPPLGAYKTIYVEGGGSYGNKGHFTVRGEIFLMHTANVEKNNKPKSISLSERLDKENSRRNSRHRSRPRSYFHR